MKKLLVFLALFCCFPCFAQQLKLSEPGVVTTIAPKNAKVLLHFNGDFKNTATGDFWTPRNALSSIQPEAAKYGTGGLKKVWLNSTNSGLEAPAVDVAAVSSIGSNDFVLQAWFQVASITSAVTSTGGQPAAVFYLSKSAGDFLAFSFASAITAGNATQYGLNVSAFLPGAPGSVISYTLAGANVGTWYHVAFSRVSGSMTIYINGTSVKSGTTSASAYNLTGLTRVYDFVLNGSGINLGFVYLDDLCITTDVYTGSFTPPNEIGRLISAKVAIKTGAGRISISEDTP